jgi:hypothetical protein
MERNVAKNKLKENGNECSNGSQSEQNKKPIACKAILTREKVEKENGKGNNKCGKYYRNRAKPNRVAIVI